MKIVYGTTNAAKLAFMQTRLQGLPCSIIGLDELEQSFCLPEIDETGNDPLENAIIKARAYAEVLKMPVFSCDSGLYIDGLEDERQPGVQIRRVNGKRLTDAEMVAYYAALAKELGGQMTARYRNAICLVADGNDYMAFDDTLCSEPFLLCDTPHAKRVEGFPLDSLSMEIKSGRYYYDLTDEEKQGKNIQDGWYRFFAEALKKRAF